MQCVFHPDRFVFGRSMFYLIINDTELKITICSDCANNFNGKLKNQGFHLVRIMEHGMRVWPRKYDQVLRSIDE